MLADDFKTLFNVIFDHFLNLIKVNPKSKIMFKYDIQALSGRGVRCTRTRQHTPQLICVCDLLHALIIVYID